MILSSIAGTARLAFLDTLRRPAFWISGLCFLLVAGLSAFPFSPGVPADPGQYWEAGLATLLLGGCLLSLLLVPLLLDSGKDSLSGEAFLALPLSGWILVPGLFAGFCSALVLYFIIGGVAVLLAGGEGTISHSPSLVAGLLWGFLVASWTAALALLFSRIFSYVPALVLTLLILSMGHFAFLGPVSVVWLLPRLALPGSYSFSGPGFSPACLQLVLFSAFCLCLACPRAGKGKAH